MSVSNHMSHIQDLVSIAHIYGPALVNALQYPESKITPNYKVIIDPFSLQKHLCQDLKCGPLGQQNRYRPVLRLL
jgi:hypothetical protein